MEDIPADAMWWIVAATVLNFLATCTVIVLIVVRCYGRWWMCSGG